MSYFEFCEEEETGKVNQFQERFVITILDKEIEIDKTKIILTDDKFILFDNKIPMINFAGCWNSGHSSANYIAIKPKILTGYTNIPPIPYRVYEDGYHLKIELFNNSFVRMTQERIKGYSISREPIGNSRYDPIQITDF